jgi:hypothetical protein
MVIMFRMTPEKKEKMVRKLDKMEDFIEEFRSCLEESAEEDDSSFRQRYSSRDWEDEDERMKSRYSRMGRRGGM